MVKRQINKLTENVLMIKMIKSYTDKMVKPLKYN